MPSFRHRFLYLIPLFLLSIALLTVCPRTHAGVTVKGLEAEEWTAGRPSLRFVYVQSVEGAYLSVADDLAVGTSADVSDATSFAMTYWKGGTTSLRVKMKVKVKKKYKSRWRYLSAGADFSVNMVADLGPSELWHRVTQPDGTIALRSAHGQFLARADDGSVEAASAEPAGAALLTVAARKERAAPGLLEAMVTEIGKEMQKPKDALAPVAIVPLVIPDGTFGDGEVVHLQSADGKYLSAATDGTLHATAAAPELDATFELVRHRDKWGDDRPAGIGETVSLKTRHGTYVSTVSASASATLVGPDERWEYLANPSYAMFRSFGSVPRFLSSNRQGVVSASGTPGRGETWTVVVVEAGDPVSRGPEYVRFTNDRGEYLTAGQDRSLRTPGKNAGSAATFELIRHDDGTVSLKTVYGGYVMAENEISVAAGARRIGPTEKWGFADEGGRVSLRGHYNGWLKSESDGRVTLRGETYQHSGTRWTMVVADGPPSLEVAGSPPAQPGAVAPSGEIPTLSLGDIITLRPSAQPGALILHRNVAHPSQNGPSGFRVAIGGGSDAASVNDSAAQFWVREGMSGRGISLEAVSRPGHFLMHDGSSLRLAQADLTQYFVRSASFFLRPGWEGAKALSLEAAFLSGYYVRTMNDGLAMALASAETVEDPQFRRSASFVVVSRRQQTSFADIAARGRPAVREPGIPDGATIQPVRLKSSEGNYLGAHKSGVLHAQQETARAWERFDLICLPDETVALRVHNGKYVNAGNASGADSMGVQIGPEEKWRIVEHADGTVSFESLNGRYLGLQPHHGWVTAEQGVVTSREKWEMSEFPLNGYLVSLVVYGHGDDRAGEFSQVSPLQWKEVNRDGIFVFNETSRDEWTVYLSDPSRNITVELNLHTKTVYYDDQQGGGRRALYSIVDIYGTGEPARAGILTFPGANQSVTIDGLRDELHFGGLTLIEPSAELTLNQCTVIYAGADAEDISAEFGMLTCAVEIGDDVTLTMAALYGGCDASNVFAEGAGSTCEAGVFSEEFTVRFPGGDFSYGVKAPSAGYCSSISSERTCATAGASLVSASWEVTDESGNGVGFAVDVGVGAGLDGGYEDGVLSVGIGLKFIIGGSITFSINAEEIGSTIYYASEAGFVFIGEQITTAGTEVVEFFGDDLGPSVKSGFEDLGKEIENGWNSFVSLF